MKENLDKMDSNIAEMYAKKCKKEPADLLALMKKGGWLTAKEALYLCIKVNSLSYHILQCDCMAFNGSIQYLGIYLSGLDVCMTKHTCYIFDRNIVCQGKSGERVTSKMECQAFLIPKMTSITCKYSLAFWLVIFGSLYLYFFSTSIAGLRIGV